MIALAAVVSLALAAPNESDAPLAEAPAEALTWQEATGRRSGRVLLELTLGLTGELAMAGIGVQLLCRDYRTCDSFTVGLGSFGVAVGTLAAGALLRGNGKAWLTLTVSVLGGLLYGAFRQLFPYSSSGSLFLVLPNVAAITAFELTSDTVSP